MWMVDSIFHDCEKLFSRAVSSPGLIERERGR
jgi:hypothetical protein